MFNGGNISKVYKRLNFNEGVSMYDLKLILNEKFEVDAYLIDHTSYICSNMLVHTYYRDVGHFMYVIYASSKFVFIYDPRRVFCYRMCRRVKLSNFIDYNKPVRALLIDNKINYKLIFWVIFLDLVFVLSMLLISSFKLVIFLSFVLCFIKIIKKVKNIK